MLASDAFGALTAELRRTEAERHDLDALMPRLVAARGFEDADDIASVLHYRLTRATSQPADSGRTRRPARLLAGLIPQARGRMSDEMRQALSERETLIEQRADAILDIALTEQDAWIKRVGDQPVDERAASQWRQYARTVAAYRDRYQITGDHPLGVEPGTAAAKIDHARARLAVAGARRVSGPTSPSRQGAPIRNRIGPSLS